MPSQTENKYENKRILCFGSRRARFDSMKKPRDYPGPFEYYQERSLLKKGPNKTGYTLLASRTPRDKDFRAQPTDLSPPIGIYDIVPTKTFKPAAKPFGIGSKRATVIKWLTPAPGTHSLFKRQVKVCTCFGRSNRIIVPLVKINCGQFNMAKCCKCGETPVGDYWHRNSPKLDLCRPCMEKEIAELKKCSTSVSTRFRMKTEQAKYYLMRYCGFYHDHHCTKAAVQIMPKKYLRYKLQTENYLASFGF